MWYTIKGMNAAHILPFTSDPVLIVDNQNLLGSWIYSFLNHKSLTVFVSSVKLSDDALVHIPYGKKLPEIPDTRYETMYVVWNGDTTELDTLPEFIEKARLDSTNFVFILPHTLYDPSIVQMIRSHLSKAYIFVVGDMFGETKTTTVSRVSTLVSEAKKTQSLVLSQMGLLRIYPVTYEDTAKLIVKTVSFGIQYTQQLLIFPKLSLTELAFSRMLQKIDPDLRIDFRERKYKPASTAFLQNGTYLVEDEYPLQEKLLLLWKRSGLFLLRSERRTMHVRPVENQTSVTTLSKTLLASLSYLLLLLIFMPFLGTVGFSLLGTQALATAKTVAEQKNADSAMQFAQLAQTSFAFADSFGSLLFIESKLLNKEAAASSLLEQIHSNSSISQALSDAILGQRYFSQLFTGKSVDPQTTLLAGTNAIKSSILALQSVQESGFIPSAFAPTLQNLRPSIELFSTVLDALPSVLGMESSKHYLVLIDNTLQLRPSGGVVSAYGEVTLTKGKFSEFHLLPVSVADSKVPAQGTLPMALRRYDGISTLTLKDGLFGADFSQNAATIVRIFSEETGTHMDGVITMDTTFLQQLLGLTGAIQVDGVNVSADNFYTSLQAQPLFLPHFSDAMFAHLGSNPESLLPVSAFLVQAVREKHILMAFSDPATQTVFTVGGASSSLWDGRSTNSARFNDFFGVSETNVGNNNANFFIQRSLSQHVTITADATYTAQTTVLYHNAAQPGAADGNYLAYLHIVLPETAVVTGIALDDTIQQLVPAITDPAIYSGKTFKAPKGLEVDTVVDSGKKSVGFFVPIYAGSTKAVKISYTVASMPFVTKQGTYSLKLFKQPGTDSMPYSLQVSYPSTLQVGALSGGFSSQGTTLTSLDMLSADTTLEATFTQN